MFPPLPDTTGEYKTVFIEPIALSGERISICSIARMSTGESKVIQTIPSATLVCMYGGQAQAMESLIESIVKDANIWLDGNMPLEQYKPPFSNTFCSHTYTINTENIEQLIQAAIQTTASLAPLNFLEQKIESVETIVETGGLAKRFVTKVKSTVVEMSPTLTKNFNVKIGNMHRYHFVGDKYAANLGAMNPSSPYNSINQAKRLLWDLSVIGQYDWTVEKKELIIYMPEDDKITYSKKQYENAKDTLSRFEEEADKKEIMLFTTCSAKHASERLIKAA